MPIANISVLSVLFHPPALRMHDISIILSNLIFILLWKYLYPLHLLILGRWEWTCLLIKTGASKDNFKLHSCQHTLIWTIPLCPACRFLKTKHHLCRNRAWPTSRCLSRPGIRWWADGHYSNSPQCRPQRNNRSLYIHASESQTFCMPGNPSQKWFHHNHHIIK